MKNISILVYLLLLNLGVNAQKTIEKNIPFKGRSVSLDAKFAHNIEVKTWDKSTIYFKAVAETKDNLFLEDFQVSFDESDGSIRIMEKAEELLENMQREWRENHSGSKKRHYYCSDHYDFNYTLYVPKNATFEISSMNGDMQSENIEGDFTADLINGNIEIKQYQGNLDLSTINGEIDLRVSGAKLVAETIHGNIYANEKLNLVSHDRHVGQRVEKKSSNTSSRLKLNTINGNMYLR